MVHFRRTVIFIFLLILCIGLLTSCNSANNSQNQVPKNKPETGNVGTIVTEKQVEIGTFNASPQGNLISYDQSGDALEGLVLDIPSGAYEADTTFKISYAQIKSHTFGDAVTPISPMITVENGGQFSSEPMVIRVPVNVPEGYIAMGFFYDQETGNIESMPLSSFDAESVTVSTLHFSSFFISMIDKALLEKPVDSGFLPGVDDWQFVNRGSYIAPNGHCAGQSAAAQWYYLAKPDGADTHLYNLYDNNGQQKTPELWQDDSYGYRLCSVVQADLKNVSSLVDSIDEKWLALAGVAFKQTVVNNNINWEKIEVPSLGDEFTRCLFAYGIMVTGQPQQVAIYSNAGGGHSMLVYRVDKDNLYIADPNYPGNTDRRIAFSNGTFTPYNSGANGDEIEKGYGKAYEKILFYPVLAMLPKDKIEQRWTEFKEGTIGGDLFPSYQIKYKDEKGIYQELKDGYVTNQKLFDAISSEAILYIYRDGEKLAFDKDFNITLKPGNNLLGFYSAKKSNNVEKYVDFKYINVIYTGLAITPDPLVGETGKEYTFTASMEVKAADIHYEWMVNNALRDSKAEPSFTYTFPTKGDHTVSVKAFSGNKELGKDDARVTMIDPVIVKLSPEILEGEPNIEYTFDATLENMPDGTIFHTWYVNGVQKQSSTSPNVKLTFNQMGEFEVSVIVSTAGKDLSNATSKVNIKKAATPVNHLPILQQNGYFEANMNIRALIHVYDKYSTPNESDVEENAYFWTAATPIFWDGIKFSGSRNDVDAAGTTMTQTILGTVSSDGNTILSLTCQLQVEAADQSTYLSFSLQNIPVKYINDTLDNFYLTSIDVQKYVVSLEKKVQSKYMGEVYHSITYLSPIWASDDSMQVVFRKTLNP